MTAFPIIIFFSVRIQKVDQSKATESSATNNGAEEPRSDLLTEIRRGFELRPAANRELGAQRESSGAGTDALAEALRRALEQRGRVIRESSDSESDSSGNDGEWD